MLWSQSCLGNGAPARTLLCSWGNDTLACAVLRSMLWQHWVKGEKALSLILIPLLWVGHPNPIVLGEA